MKKLLLLLLFLSSSIFAADNPCLGSVGCTGVNNGNRTITVGGNLNTSGAFNTVGGFGLTFNLSALTNLTLPTSGTVATLSDLGSVNVTNDNDTNAVMYPLWVSGTSGAQSTKVSSNVFAWNPAAELFRIGNLSSSFILAQSYGGDAIVNINRTGTNSAAVEYDAGGFAIWRAGLLTSNTDYTIRDQPNGQAQLTIKQGSGATGIATFAGVVNIGSAGTASSVFDIGSTAKGSRPYPSMTGAQRDAISSPAEGLTVYNTDTHKPSLYNGTSWVSGSLGGDLQNSYDNGTPTAQGSIFLTADNLNPIAAFATTTDSTKLVFEAVNNIANSDGNWGYGFRGPNSSSNYTQFARIQASAPVATEGAESARLLFLVKSAGANLGGLLIDGNAQEVSSPWPITAPNIGNQRSGSYAPTVTCVSGCSSPASVKAFYQYNDANVGSTQSINAEVTFTATATTGVVRVSCPVDPNFNASGEASGVGTIHRTSGAAIGDGTVVGAESQSGNNGINLNWIVSTDSVGYTVNVAGVCQNQ